MVKNEILKNINKIISKPCNDSTNLEDAEKLLLEYLDINSKDDECWYKLVVLQLIPPLSDFENAISILEKRWNLTKNIKAIYFIVIIQDIYSFIDEKFISIINNANDNNSIDLSVKHYCLGLYYLSIENEIIAKKYFEKAIFENKTFVNSYIKLGNIYKNTDSFLMKSYYKMALENINEIIISYDMIKIEIFDWLSIKNFEEEIIFGNLITDERFKYLKSLVSDSSDMP